MFPLSSPSSILTASPFWNAEENPAGIPKAFILQSFFDKAIKHAYCPKNPESFVVLKSSEISTYQGVIRTLIKLLKYIDDKQFILTQNPAEPRRLQILESRGKLFNLSLDLFIKLYDTARLTITKVDPTFSPLMQEIHTLNQKAQTLNQQIEDVKQQLAQRLIANYPDFSFLLKDPPCEALNELHSCCLSLVGGTKSAG